MQTDLSSTSLSPTGSTKTNQDGTTRSHYLITESPSHLGNDTAVNPSHGG